MGNFTEIVISFAFKPETPPEIMGAVASLARGASNSLLKPPTVEVHRYNPHDEPLEDPLWQYDWGPFFGLDMSGVRGGLCSADLAPKSEFRPDEWTLTARSVHKAYPDELTDAFLWLGPYACPLARPDLLELCGYLKTEASDQPILIWHDGERFVLDDLNQEPGHYR
jgi:hypothetical protein